MTKRRIPIIVLVIVALLLFVVAFTQPFVIHRLSTKVFTGYELSLLKYPDSHLIEREIRATSKTTMATDYMFYSPYDFDTVLEFMEQQRPGYVQLQGSYVIVEPTFRNTTCANETMFNGIFQILERGVPCIEVSIYPATTGGTSIRISENWSSMGFPEWLRTW
ncbi:MAG: hypothetical protein ACOYYU_01340 [Chloroflexota bacterium]